MPRVVLRRAAILALTAGVIALLPALAWARAAARILPGQKLFGELGAGDSATVLFHAVGGMSFSATCKAFKGTPLKPGLSLAAPDGASVDLSAVTRVNPTGQKVSLKGLVLAQTGSYRLTVAALGGTSGGFDLATAGTAPSKVGATGSVGAADAVAPVSFDGLPGDRATCRVKAARRSPLKPLLLRFVDAGGAETPIGAPRQTAPVVVAANGTSRFDVSGADGTTGDFTASVRIVRAKAPKAAVDVADVEALGAVSGVVVVEGQVARETAARGAKAARRRTRPAQAVRPGEIVVAAPQAGGAAEVEAAVEASLPGARAAVAASLSARGPYLVRIDAGAPPGPGRRGQAVTRALAKAAAASGRLAWAEPNALVHSSAEPADPRYPEQFNLRYLRLPRLWDRTAGDASIVVAVVDTGSLVHPDLLNRWLPGYDFVFDPASGEDGDGWDADATDDSRGLHGLHVAGIIGARVNNKAGIAGVVWQTRILPVRVLGKDGWGTFFDVAAGLRWAAGLDVPYAPPNPNPARVVNMSLGALYDAAVLRDAVAEVHAETDAVIVAAAGNESTSEREYPAAYPGVIPVHALDANLNWASYSNYGDWISVGAPGGDPYRGQAGILSTYADPATLQPTYQEMSGTSMATPQVAGVAALLLALDGTLTRDEIRDALEKTALDLGPPGFDVDFGWGMVNADKAAEYVLTPYAPPDLIEVAPDSLAFEGIENQARLFVRTRQASPVQIQQIDVETYQGAGWLAAATDSPQTPATVTVTVDPDLDAGLYHGRLRLTTSAGIVDVPVLALRVPRPKITVVLVKAVAPDGRVVAQTSTTKAANWAYTIPHVPLGRFRIVAAADADADLAVDRVDEWEGVWPIRSQPGWIDVAPDALDGDGVDVPLERYDERFSYDGVGAGRVAGAIAVRAFDARSGRPVPGARVHLGDGSAQSTTDARGRAVLVGAFSGGQTVTVVADGYQPVTRSGSDAQYQSFALEPDSARPTRQATVVLHGLAAGDREVFVQAGDAQAWGVYDGVLDPSFDLTLAETGGPYAVSAVVADALRQPTRSALVEFDDLPAVVDVDVAPFAVGARQARYVLPTLPAGINSSSASLAATTSYRWDDRAWVAVGRTALAAGQDQRAWWVSPGAFQPPLAMKLECGVADAAGRWSRHAFHGDTSNLQLPDGAFTFLAPPLLTGPADGAVGVGPGPLLQWSNPPGSGVNVVVVEDATTGRRWTLLTSGLANQARLPDLSPSGLAADTVHRWSVEAYRFASFDYGNWRTERLDTSAADRSFSGWRTFRTQ